jgi:hypothetical protein
MKTELVKALCFLLCFVTVMSSVCAQNGNATQLPDLIPYRKGDKWGYCDRNKKNIIPADFEEASLFGVKPDEKYLDVPDSIAYVKMDNKEYCLTKSGKLIGPGRMSSFSNDEGIVAASGGMTMIESVYKKTFKDPKTGKVGLLGRHDAKGKYDTLIPARFDDIEPNVLNDSIDHVSIRENGKWGLMLASSQKMLLKPAYDTVQYTGVVKKNGIIRLAYRVRANSKVGYFIQDKLVLPARYKSIYEYGYRVLQVRTDSGTNLVDLDGKTIASGYEVKGWAFERSDYAPVIKNGKWGLMSIRGKLVAPCKYEDYNTTRWDLWWVTYKGKKGLIDFKGTEYFED